jgi:hypothetical protein
MNPRLTRKQRNHLHRLERNIICILGARIHNGDYAKWDEQRLAAVEALYDEEKRLGVYDPYNNQCPRWPKP